jgi:hypothetical protein
LQASTTELQRHLQPSLVQAVAGRLLQQTKQLGKLQEQQLQQQQAPAQPQLAQQVLGPQPQAMVEAMAKAA